MGLAKGKALPTRNDLFLFTLKLLTRMSQQEIISVYNREFDATAIPGDARNRWARQLKRNPFRVSLETDGPTRESNPCKLALLESRQSQQQPTSCLLLLLLLHILLHQLQPIFTNGCHLPRCLIPMCSLPWRPLRPLSRYTSRFQIRHSGTIPRTLRGLPTLWFLQSIDEDCTERFRGTYSQGQTMPGN
ncbi:conserved hypothetical protein [Coccidioides posadasii str. Silveira]|uniref:Uncharacterized protein n=1 Tax=Coccidioides posadasii (strain RMSCC 757 / Silveira) TaxID=443226 RepID=E9DA03_COCPS|nr:conserved hypothetical protein [Coccidioides posadasii str. Silveira]